MPNSSLTSTSSPSLSSKFVSAGLAACVADLITFPLDTAKVRLQIQGEQCNISNKKYQGVFGTILTMVREEGWKTPYNGLIPGLQRQLCFASIRIGLYDSVKEIYMHTFVSNVEKRSAIQTLMVRILAAVTTGALSVLFFQPTDVIKVRLQAQQCRNQRYSSVWHAYRTTYTIEGFQGLWKGTMPNISRNSIVNASEMVSYDFAKEFLLHRGMIDGMPCHFLSAFTAGFITTVIASPVDVIKTRYMNSLPGMYRGAVHCCVTMFSQEGITAFYKGFTPSFLRLGSWNVVMFVAFEQLKRYFNNQIK